MTATTKFYCDNKDILLGMRHGIWFAADAPINVSQVLSSDNPLFNYMLTDEDSVCRDDLVCRFLSREGAYINQEVSIKGFDELNQFE